MKNKINMLADKIVKTDNGVEIAMIDNKIFIEVNGSLQGPYEAYQELQGSNMLLLMNTSNNGSIIDAIDENSNNVASGLSIGYKYSRPSAEQSEKLKSLMDKVDIKPMKIIPFSEAVLCSIYGTQSNSKLYVVELSIFGTKFQGAYDREKKWIVEPGANKISIIEKYGTTYLVANYGDVEALMDEDGKRIVHGEYKTIEYMNENISLVGIEGSDTKTLIYSDRDKDNIIATDVRLSVVSGVYLITSKLNEQDSKMEYTYGIVHIKSRRLLLDNASYILAVQENEVIGMVDDNVVYIVEDKVETKPEVEEYTDSEQQHAFRLKTNSGIVIFTTDWLLTDKD